MFGTYFVEREGRVEVYTVSLEFSSDGVGTYVIIDHTGTRHTLPHAPRYTDIVALSLYVDGPDDVIDDDVEAILDAASGVLGGIFVGDICYVFIRSGGVTRSIVINQDDAVVDVLRGRYERLFEF